MTAFNDAWGFLKALEEDQAFEMNTPNSLRQTARPFNQQTIHPAITGLMDRTQNPYPGESRTQTIGDKMMGINRNRTFYPPSRDIGSTLPSRARTPAGQAAYRAASFPPAYPRALDRDTRINPDTLEEGRIQEIGNSRNEIVSPSLRGPRTQPPPSGSPQHTIDALERDKGREVGYQRPLDAIRRENQRMGTYLSGDGTQE